MDFIEEILNNLKMKPPILPSREKIIQIINLIKEILILEENILNISGPVTVIGDIHGQFYDLLEIFNIEEEPPFGNFLFLGDFVDRGFYSVEVMIFLICLKIKFPNNIYLIRGNHECEYISRMYGFYNECLTKFNSEIEYLEFIDFFKFLPISALISNQVFGVHGGLSPSIHLIDQIKTINRFIDVPQQGSFSDLLWSDPNLRIKLFNKSTRGAGFTYGQLAVEKFCHLNKLNHICRSHQLSMKGYELYFNNLLSTVWSAPNYEYRSGNIASILNISIDGNKLDLNFKFFDAVPDSERCVPNIPDMLSNYFL